MGDMTYIIYPIYIYIAAFFKNERNFPVGNKGSLYMEVT